MAPIRVGVIGLSKSAKTSWASAAHFPYLIASNGKYEIKALCNSSKDAAQKAIEEYNLPASTKAYGDPQDLANDPDVRSITFSLFIGFISVFCYVLPFSVLSCIAARSGFLTFNLA